MEEQILRDTPTESELPKKKKGSCISRMAKVILILFFIWWFNNYTLKINEKHISSDKVNNDVKLAVLSDLHAYDGIFSIDNKTIIKKIKRIDPDAVCVLGDMHSSNADETEKQISMDLMTGIIDEGYKLYFVLGEHDDRTNAYVDKMEKNKIHVLDGEAEKITIGDTDLKFYGISNAFFSPSFDLTNEFDIDKSTYNILLAHIPMYSDYEKFGADLTLCGDTHGGIIQIPFLGPAYYNGKFVPELYEDKNKIFDKGLFKYDGGYLFITSGIGNYIGDYNIAARFNNRPEIAVLTISPE